jgi:uncharacterized protein
VPEDCALGSNVHLISIEQARLLYGAADSVHDFDHILRVLALAERIALAEGAELTVVRCAALLHDWGRVDEATSQSNHAAVAAARTISYLTARGTAPVIIDAVAHAIEAHRFRTPPAPQTLEAQVLFDADKLDAIGAIGVARAFAYGGAHNQRLWAARQTVDLGRWQQVGDDVESHTPVHEFVVKLSRIREQLYTPMGRRIAEERHRYMAAFFDRLDSEIRGEA